MQIVLLERVENLGQMGDVVTVRPGYARNFLLPLKKALRATKSNLEYFETRRSDLEAINLKRKQESESVAERLNGTTVVIIRRAGDTGQLYGSVSSRDVAEALDDAGAKVERRQVQLASPIKSLGMHDVRITLHPEVAATVIANVARSEDEAARQARGEDLTVIEDEFELEEIDEDDDLPEVFDEAGRAQGEEAGDRA